MYYYEIMVSDMDGCVYVMRQNMQDDLRAGYDPRGACIIRQREEIAAYAAKCAAKKDRALEILAEKGEKACERFCRAECIRRGAILPGE